MATFEDLELAAKQNKFKQLDSKRQELIKELDEVIDEMVKIQLWYNSRIKFSELESK